MVRETENAVAVPEWSRMMLYIIEMLLFLQEGSNLLWPQAGTECEFLLGSTNQLVHSLKIINVIHII